MSDYQGNIIIKNPATPTGPSAYGSAPGMWKLNEVAYWIKQGVWPNPAITPDTYFPYVSLLLSTTSLGNANNNLFVDSSGAFNPVSRNGNATQGSFTPYSANWSNYFDGSGDYFTAPYTSANFDWWTSGTDFTIEYWFFANSSTGISYSDAGINHSTVVGNRSATSTTDYWSFGPTSAGTVTFYYYNGGGNGVTSTATYSLNTWNHVAMTKTSSGITIFVNGVAGTTTAISGTPQSSTGVPLTVGQGNNSSFNGYVSNLRIVRGTAIYSGNFTVPTAPLTAVTNTTLLTCQSNRFRDASTNNLTLTVTGNTSVQDFSPFSPAYPGLSYNQSDITNWSGYFDGSGDYLVGPSSSQFAFGTGDYTLEGWFYTAATGTERRIFYFNDDRNNVDVTSSNTIIMYDGAVRTFGTPVPNAWNHFAVSRASGTVRCYLNGVLGYSGSETSNTSTRTLYVGANSSGVGPFNGYLSNLRVVKGTAVYTGASLTVPTTPLTAISGTSLLTCQNAAFTDNSSNNFILTQNGNPTVTGNSPFNTTGYWSNYFNGSSYLTAANNAAIQLGTGAFTVEGWFNIPSYAANQPLFDQRASGPSSNAFIIYVKTTGTLAFYSYSPGIDVTFNTVISTNAWNHFAFVRSGNTGTMYVNGVAQSTTIDLSAYNNTSSANRIMQSFDPSYATGYLSNFRIVKGTAVYTANFTPPTAPLTAISGTGLLTCQSGSFIDNSGNNLTITVNGSPSVQSFDPFYTSTIASNGGSMYFDGSGDYLSVPNGQLPFSFGTSNFTIEAWVYLTSIPGVYAGITDCRTSGSFQSWGLGMLNSSGTMRVDLIYGPSRLTGSTTSIPANTWTHVAVSRSSGTLRIFVNGVVDSSTASYSSAMDSTTTLPLIGNMVDNYPMIGYMSDFRVTKGSALYTSSFTPPTAPVTPTASTTMLVNGMNAGIYDATTINDMETVGNAQVRYPSPFAPADYYAGAFDGSGDYISAGSNAAFAFGTGAYTTEAWVYITGSNSLNNLFCNDTTNGFDLYFNYSSNTTLLEFRGGSNVITFNAIPTRNTWTHVALVREGTGSNQTKLYFNGVLQGSGTDATNWTVTGPMLIGAIAAGAALSGSISNARIVKGTAVYTSNFTPSTTPLTAISGTSLLTCQNKTFIDNSTNAFTITAFGNATAGAIGPFTATGGTSVYFDGSGDALAARTNPAFAFGTGSFTIEAWVNVISYAGTCAIFDTRTAGNEATGVIFYITASGQLSIYNNGTLATSSGSISPNTWAHVAVTRNGTTVTFWINGASSGTATVSTNFTQQNGYVGTAYNASSNPFYGYMDDLRITKGVARYTSNFTPPTQAFPTY